MRERISRRGEGGGKDSGQNKLTTDDRELVGKRLGGGQFGVVYQGLLRNRHNSTMEARDVAVKQLKPDLHPGSEETKEFFDEMQLMMELGQHSNVLSLVGTCRQETPLLMLIEFSDKGDLLHYLRDRRAKGRRRALLDQDHFIDFSAQAAAGMEFLAKNKVRGLV